MDGETPTTVPETTGGEQVVEQPVETATPETTPAPVAETPNWQELLEKADAKELRKHPKVAGIIGSEIQRAIQAERQRLQEEEARKASDLTEQELLRFSEENADYIKEKYPKVYEHLTRVQRQRIERELQDIHGKTRHELATAIGRAIAEIPEWKDLAESDHQKLAEELRGKAEDEVIPLFQRLVTDMVADKRARRIYEQWKEKELAKAREAIRQEEAAKLLKTSEAPDITKPKGQPSGIDIWGMSDEQFDEYWRKRFKR